VLAFTGLAAGQSSGDLFFDERVEPILGRRCVGCHNDELKDGGISFMDRDSLLKGGGRGPAIVPGKPESSVLIQAVRQEGELQMPPGAKLSAQDIATLTDWIAHGAVWGKPVLPRHEPVRLPPAAFPELPKDLVRELQRLGCTIPQASGARAPHNVIRGEFGESGKVDWAVLCSKDRASTVLVFWRGRTRNPGRIGRAEDGDLFTRVITAIGREDIREHFRAQDGQKLPAIDHQGIGNESVSYYYFRGKWLQLRN
jgi:Planctomycete cytochrome C